MSYNIYCHATSAIYLVLTQHLAYYVLTIILLNTNIDVRIFFKALMIFNVQQLRKKVKNKSFELSLPHLLQKAKP